MCEKLLNLSDFKIALIKKMEEHSESYLREIDESIQIMNNLNNTNNRSQGLIQNNQSTNRNNVFKKSKKNLPPDDKKINQKSKNMNVINLYLNFIKKEPKLKFSNPPRQRYKEDYIN